MVAATGPRCTTTRLSVLMSFGEVVFIVGRTEARKRLPSSLRGEENKPDQHGQIGYNRLMKTVNISNLKAQLSAHIQLVREGEEVLVCDRNKPVARIVPCRLEKHSVQEQRLIARGVLTPPLKKRPARVSWPEPPGNVSDEVMEQIWREERESRRSADRKDGGLP